MNAGPDVERLISDWLTEEAPAHAPERVLDEAASTIDRTKQRRFGAAWREPMSISMPRLVASAAVIIVAIVGAGWLGRASASQVAAPAPTIASPSPSPSSDGSTAAAELSAFRTARNSICANYGAQGNPLKRKLQGIYDPATPAAQRETAMTALRDVLRVSQQMTAELSLLEAPEALRSAAAAAVARGQDINSLIAGELNLLTTGDFAGAKALDLATNPLARDIEQFERQNGLAPCP